MSQASITKQQVDEAVAAFAKAGTKSGAAKLLGLPTSTFKNRLEGAVRQSVKIKMLFLDIETCPNAAWVWGLWDQDISLKQLVAPTHMLCWAARWHGDDKMHFGSIQKSTTKQMLAPMHKMLNEADVVVSYNGIRFDIPHLNREFLLNGMSPPSPYKQIDLLRVVKSRFKFPSNKLDYVAQALGLGKKHAHSGFQLWIDVMANKAKAWIEMTLYNKHDVVLLETVYEKLKGWITNHPNVGLYSADPECCPNCGSTKLKANGYAYTAAAQYKRFVCLNCGAWPKGKATGVKRKFSPA